MATYLIGNIKGPKGADGVSPTANVEQVANGAVITITDASGTTTALVRNGVDGDGNNIDLTPYATWTGMDAAINEIKDDYATKDELEDAISNVSVPVTSVNGLVGDVVIPAPDLTGYATQTWVNSQNFLQQAPVSSVNAKTGDVVLTATDVGALPDSTTIPTKTSDLTNDSNFVNQNTMTTWLATKQDVLTAGANIDITNGVISASGNADELPTIASGDAGKVLTVNSGATGLEWTTPASGGGSSYTDADVYNAIQNKFGMSSGQGINWDMIGDNDNRGVNDVVFNMWFPINSGYTYYKVEQGTNSKQFHTVYDETKDVYYLVDEDNSEYTITWEEVGTDDYMWTYTYNPSDWDQSETIHFTLYGGMDGTITNPLNSNFMPWDELDSRYSSGSSYSDEDVANYISNTFGMSYSNITYTENIGSTSGSNGQVVFSVDDTYGANVFYLTTNDNQATYAENGMGIYGDGTYTGNSFGTDYPLTIDYSTTPTTVTVTYSTEYFGEGTIEFTLQAQVQNMSRSPLDSNFMPWDELDSRYGSGGGGSSLPADELPDYSNASAGDVLAVDSNGGLEWTTPISGGATYTAGNGIEIDANNEISTTQKPPRVITVNNIVNGNAYSQDDKEYIINAIDNGIADYPFVIDVSNYGVIERYIPVGRNNTQIKIFSIGEKKTVNIGYVSSTGALAFSTNPIDGTYIQTRLTAANAPSGAGNNTVDNELKYIKTNYATKAELPTDELPSITSGDAGKVLTVNNSETGVEWITPASGGGSSGSGGVKYVDVSQGMIASSFNSNAELLTIGQALADGDDIPIIAIRNGNKTGELWYLINTNRVTGDGGATYTVYCDWYSPVTNEICHNRYNGSIQQWKDQSTSRTYNYYCTSPTGGSVGDVLAVRSIHSSTGQLFFEWKSIKGDSATNAASALYLKDTNNQVYEIKVDTNGSLTATAVSNS